MNRSLYDSTTGPIWRRVVYDGLHGGAEFINLGGHQLLETIASRAGLMDGSAVLEFGCGRGAVARYFAERHRCAVTAIDLNPRQVLAARTAGDAGGAIRYIQADLLEWEPDRRYDVVVCVDTLMLLADSSRALARACLAAAPRGRVFASTLGAGRALTPKLREWLWTSDGMVSLNDAATCAVDCIGAGLVDVTVEDWTEVGVSASQRMLDVLDAQSREIRTEAGAKAFDEWRSAGAVYLDAFRTGALVYLLVSGRAPGTRNGTKRRSPRTPQVRRRSGARLLL